MNKYETLFIIKPDQTEEQIQAVLDRLVQRIEATQGKAAIIEHWGNRRLAYPVQYRGERLRRGYYVLLTYLGEGATVDEVERNIKILDPTFRYLTVKLEDNVAPDSVSELLVTHRSETETSARPEWKESSAPEPESVGEAEAEEGRQVAAAPEKAASPSPEAEKEMTNPPTPPEAEDSDETDKEEE